MDYTAIHLRSDFRIFAEGYTQQHRLVPVQATQQSNAPGTSVPEGFAS
jgi:hypothetical protein